MHGVTQFRWRRWAALTALAATLPLAGCTSTAQSDAAHSSAGAPKLTAAAANAVTEKNDFRFPGADTMALPGSNNYITYGASSGGRKVPYTISGSGNTPAPSAKINGDAWKGVVFPKGYWAKKTSGIWTPGAWTMVKGKTRYYYLFYTAVATGTDGKHCVGVAHSTRPGGPFHPQAKALACPSRASRWAIDSDVTQGPGSAIWMVWRDGERATAGTGESALSVSQLGFNANGSVTRSAKVAVMLRSDHLTWTHYKDGGVTVIENPSAAYINKAWYLFYSGNSFTGPFYATGVAYCGARIDHACTPMPGPKQAYFAYNGASKANKITSPATCKPGGVRPLNKTTYPAGMRLRGLPGNKRSIGAMDLYKARNGQFWVTWNYRSDSNWCTRKSRVGHLHISGSGAKATFTVSLT